MNRRKDVDVALWWSLHTFNAVKSAWKTPAKKFTETITIHGERCNCQLLRWTNQLKLLDEFTARRVSLWLGQICSMDQRSTWQLPESIRAKRSGWRIQHFIMVVKNWNIIQASSLWSCFLQLYCLHTRQKAASDTMLFRTDGFTSDGSRTTWMYVQCILKPLILPSSPQSFLQFYLFLHTEVYTNFHASMMLFQQLKFYASASCAIYQTSSSQRSWVSLAHNL